MSFAEQPRSKGALLADALELPISLEARSKRPLSPAMLGVIGAGVPVGWFFDPTFQWIVVAGGVFLIVIVLNFVTKNDSSVGPLVLVQSGFSFRTADTETTILWGDIKEFVHLVGEGGQYVGWVYNKTDSKKKKGDAKMKAYFGVDAVLPGFYGMKPDELTDLLDHVKTKSLLSRKEFPAVTGFYDQHPINEIQILDAVRARGVATSDITEEHLKEFDQDHYGGIEALEVLAEAAQIKRHHHVLDICSGMGGPARYLAHTLGCRATGIDLTESRVAGATSLTKLAKLEAFVNFEHGNALDLPFPDDHFDVVIAQEAWAHIPHKHQLIAQATRVAKRGGVIAFTDIVSVGTLKAPTAQRLFDGMRFSEIASRESYCNLLEAAGCVVEQCVALDAEWTRILQQRHAMYRSLRASTVAKFGEEGYRRYDDAYAFFVSLYERGVLGGARLVARKLAAGSN